MAFRHRSNRLSLRKLSSVTPNASQSNVAEEQKVVTDAVETTTDCAVREDSAAGETPCRVDGDRDDRIPASKEQSYEPKSEQEADDDEVAKPSAEACRRSADVRGSKRLRKSTSSADCETTEELVFSGRSYPSKDSSSAPSRSESSSAKRYDIMLT